MEDGGEIVQVLDALKREDGSRIDPKSQEGIHQSIHACLVRATTTPFDRKYFEKAVTLEIPRDFLSVVHKDYRHTVNWQVQRLGKDADGNVIILNESKWMNFEDVQRKLKQRETEPWYMKPTGATPTKEVPVAEPVELNFGFTQAPQPKKAPSKASTKKA
jgi:hypothetical protein